jgi:hypothetical protein
MWSCTAAHNEKDIKRGTENNKFGSLLKYISFVLYSHKKKMFAKTIVTRVAPRISRRSIQTSSIARSEGAAGNTGSFGKKEKAVENQWAKSHVSTNKRWVKNEKEDLKMKLGCSIA